MMFGANGETRSDAQSDDCERNLSNLFGTVFWRRRTNCAKCHQFVWNNSPALRSTLGGAATGRVTSKNVCTVLEICLYPTFANYHGSKQLIYSLTGDNLMDIERRILGI